MTSESQKPPEPPIPIPPSYGPKEIEEKFWPKFKRVMERVPGVADILALYYYLNADRTPAGHKALIVGAIVYFIMPIDLIPDFFLGGYVDDIAVALALIRFIGTEKMKPYRIYARKWLRGEVPQDATVPEIEIQSIRVLPKEESETTEDNPKEG